jgi:hypothetical protein
MQIHDGDQVNLCWLDLSFNKITKIESLEKLVNLVDLSLFNNQIEVIENLENQTNLNVLSLGKSMGVSSCLVRVRNHVILCCLLQYSSCKSCVNHLVLWYGSNIFNSFLWSQNLQATTS